MNLVNKKKKSGRQDSSEGCESEGWKDRMQTSRGWQH